MGVGSVGKVESVLFPTFDYARRRLKRGWLIR
jgi:hypothetical protein